MKKITLLHPFSAEAIGLEEKDLFFSHSKPHELALRNIEAHYKVSIEYFTGNFYPFIKNINGIKKIFWAISSPLVNDRHKWRQQHSFWHYIHSKFFTPDVTLINMSGHGSNYVFKLAKLLRKKNSPYIAMVGGIHMSTEGEALKYYQNAHHIIVHTSIQKKELMSYVGFKNLDIRVLPLGVDTSLFLPSNELNQNTINLLFVGRISRLKQIELAVKVVYELKKTQYKSVILKIIGPISDVVYYEELMELISQLDLVNNINFIGVIEQNKLIPFFQNANLLMLPSAHESFGMVMVEAMACGTPVAALRNAGGPDEIIDNQITGLLSKKENYSSDIISYFKNEDEIFKISKNAREKVLKKYSIEITTKTLIASIESALA